MTVLDIWCIFSCAVFECGFKTVMLRLDGGVLRIYIILRLFQSYQGTSKQGIPILHLTLGKKLNLLLDTSHYNTAVSIMIKANDSQETKGLEMECQESHKCNRQHHKNIIFFSIQRQSDMNRYTHLC